MDPEHEEILANFTIQQKNQRHLASLKTLSARKVVDSLPLYAKNGLTKISHILPQSLNTFVYQVFLEPYTIPVKLSKEDWLNCTIHPDVHMEKVLFFAGDGLEAFDCSIMNIPGVPFEDRVPQYGRTFFQRLATGSPKLKSLRDMVPFIKPHFDLFWNLDEPDHLFSDHYSLQLMPNLVVLENDFFGVRDADLQIIGSCLPLLQRLLLFIKTYDDDDPSYNISKRGLKCLKKLKSLKHLSFELNSPYGGGALVKKCLAMMPRVNTVAKWMDKFTTHMFPKYKLPVELGLEHLVLGRLSTIPPNVLLPNVSKITVNNTTSVSLQQFKKLRHIAFYYVKWPEVEQTLSEVGHLEKLQLSGKACKLVKVLQLCPNLTEIILWEVRSVGSVNVSLVRNCVQKLKRFIRVLWDMKQERFIDSQGLLRLFLSSCPELEELELYGLRIAVPEMDLINKDFEAGNLAIQKLQSICILADVDRMPIFKPYAIFTSKLCVDHCKKLKFVSIDVGIHENYLTYSADFELAYRLQKFINNKLELSDVLRVERISKSRSLKSPAMNRTMNFKLYTRRRYYDDDSDDEEDM